MRHAIVAVIPLIVAGCVHTAEEQESVRSAWGTCVMNAVKRLDDGKSDPVSIAYGIAPQCGIIYAQLTEIMVSQNITEGGQAAMRYQMRTGELKLITSAIITARATRKS